MKEIKNKVVSLRGIERNTNDINSVDDACEELINLRIKDGALRPVGEKNLDIKTLTGISGYESITNIFKHSPLPDGDYVALFSDSNGQYIILTGNNISPTIQLLTATELTRTFTLNIYIGEDWTATESESWISLSKTSGAGEDSITVTCGPSIAESQTGTITVNDGSKNFTCTVTLGGLG
jgi:hypothetical protein